MPKQIPDEEFEAITRVITQFPSGASIDDISNALTIKIHRRTLQRRLAVLVEKQSLLQEGGGRGTRYRLAPAAEPAQAMLQAKYQATSDDSSLPVSPQAQGIRQAVNRPLQERKPVGYQQEFVQAYRPNKSYYLSEKIRRHLLEMGQSQAGESPAGTYALQIYNRLLIDLTWNSSRLEGNTYSLLETERLIAAGKIAEGKDALETQMILNHKSAIELLVESATEIGFNRYTICNLHALLSENLLPDPAASGRLREQTVGIGGSVFYPLQGGSLIRKQFDEVLKKADAIGNPFEQAFFAMVHLPYLQAFDDVNKRVSRLAANIPLIRENLSPLSFVDVPEQVYIDGLLGVYELNRTELLRDVFVWAYERSCARYSAVRQSLGEPDPLRLRFRDQIASLVNNIIIGRLDKTAAVSAIKKHTAGHVNQEDRQRFIEMTETELLSLHDGNIARYRVSPSQFAEWKKRWSEE